MSYKKFTKYETLSEIEEAIWDYFHEYEDSIFKSSDPRIVHLLDSGKVLKAFTDLFKNAYPGELKRVKNERDFDVIRQIQMDSWGEKSVVYYYTRQERFFLWIERRGEITCLTEFEPSEEEKISMENFAEICPSSHPFTVDLEESTP